MTQAGLVKVIQNGLQKSSPSLLFRFCSIAVDVKPGFDERPNEPGPDRALMIGAVALAHAAFVMWNVSRLAGRERAQAERRPEARLDSGDDFRGPLAVEESDRQAADGKDLIGAKRGIDGAGTMIDVDDVVKTAVVLVPKTSAERRQSLF